ncbi:MAG: acylphosphatase [Lentisphaerae bacterium]|nr:acylphosphatase [Lentisphaerota bacterium]
MTAPREPGAALRGAFLIRGHVQGVCYRMCACDEARRLGLTGWVRNASDGSVEVVVEGAAERVSEFLDWCRRGPSRAQVSGVKVDYTPASGEFLEFRIRY